MRAKWHTTGVEKKLQLFPASAPLKLITICILAPLPRTVNGNRYVIIMTDKYFKLTRTMPTGKTSSLRIATVFFDSWRVPYGIPAYILTENGLKFTSKLFAVLFTLLIMKHLETSAYHSQSNGNV